GTLTRSAVNGVATFDNLKIDRAAVGYTLRAFAANLTSATSQPFDVTTNSFAVLNTDYTAVGLGGLRNGAGTGTLSVTLPTGAVVTKAVLYWNGPTNSSDPNVNAQVSFNNSSVFG